MDYYCEVCNIFMEPKSKYKHFKSNAHREFERCKHIDLSIEKPKNDVDSVF